MRTILAREVFSILPFAPMPQLSGNPQSLHYLYARKVFLSAASTPGSLRSFQWAGIEHALRTARPCDARLDCFGNCGRFLCRVVDAGEADGGRVTMATLYWAGAAVAVALLAYLFVALLKPEIFP
jgi:K+-transporting ATPase KdpF subunit